MSLKTLDDIYAKAAALFSSKFSDEDTKSKWLSGKNSISSLQQAVLEAKRIYENKTQQSKVRIWLSKLSSRILYYGNIMDILSQHHPEYVSLAWGTIKFIFISLKLVMNNEEQVASLSKAMANIGDVLPRISLDLDLYQDEAIKSAVEEMFAYLIDFFQRVMEWYEGGSIKHALKSFTHPYALSFRDIVIQIDLSARNIESLAATLARVELRSIYTLLKASEVERAKLQALLISSQNEHQQMHSLLVEMKRVLIENHATSFSMLSSTHRSSCSIQLAQMITATSQSWFCGPESCLRYYKAILTRRSRPTTVNVAAVVNAAKAFIISSSSPILVVISSQSTRLDVKKVAIDMIDHLRQSTLPVVWALKANIKFRTEEGRLVQLLKYLIMQILQNNSQIMIQKVSAGFNAPLFQSARTESAWFDVLKIVLLSCPALYIIVDAEILMDDPIELATFTRQMKSLVRHTGEPVIKVAMVTFQRRIIQSLEEFDESIAVVNMYHSRYIFPITRTKASVSFASRPVGELPSSRHRGF